MSASFHEPRHPSNVTPPHEPPCSHVMQQSYQERCSFIKRTSECHSVVHYVDYLNFIFCTIGGHRDNLYLAGLFLIFILCLYLFTILATTADKCFTPALAVISKMLRMSENLAGVTLLAFGNGSPDMFASISHSGGDTEIVYTELLGAAAFVTCFVAGCIILVKPFHVVSRNYVRDVFFFTFSIFVINYSITDQGYTLFEGIGTVMIYVAYLAYVIIDHILVKKKLENYKALSREVEDETLQKKAEDLEDATEIKIYSRKDSSTILDEEILKVFQAEFGRSPNENLVQTFRDTLNPIDVDLWKKSGIFSAWLQILQAPVLVFLQLVIPIVDYSEERHGWSKLLNMLNIVTLPQVVLLITGHWNLMFFDSVPLALIVLIISLGVSISVFYTSRNDCPPSYHVIFAAGSFIGSICVIYTVAKEVVSVMKAIGIITDRSDSMVGLLFLAVGNSVGDLFSNISLAKNGYQQMAFAACFGGPMFNSLLGVGLTFIIKALNAKNQEAFTREGALGPNCVIFLLLGLTYPLIALTLTSFYARRCIGVLMILIYFIFIFYAWLGELEIMHPYGTDHQKT